MSLANITKADSNRFCPRTHASAMTCGIVREVEASMTVILSSSISFVTGCDQSKLVISCGSRLSERSPPATVVYVLDEVFDQLRSLNHNMSAQQTHRG